MAVRFLPPPGEEASSSGGDRADLAEVIELRSLLTHAKWRAPGSEADSQASDWEAGESEASSSEARPSKSNALETVTGEPAVFPHAEESGDLGNVVRGNFARSTDLARSADFAEIDEEDDAPGLDSAAEHPAEYHQPEDAAVFPERSANEDGVRLLARKARSSGELRHELLRLDHNPAEVEDVIEEFERSLYLDDAGLARVLTEKLRESKRASRSQIRTKLRARKLSDTAIEEAIAELGDDDEYALLRTTAADRARTMRDLDRQTAERRLLGFLARRGWSGEPASRAVREALDGAGRNTSGGSGRGGGVRFR